jgi:hypothetical protein
LIVHENTFFFFFFDDTFEFESELARSHFAGEVKAYTADGEPTGSLLLL